MQIPDYIIAQINDKADLVSIIRKHTELKPAGREFRGCCPFHGERTPSFYVNPEANLYYCFGCGAKGNAISFLVDFERLTFVEAVKELANKAGIDLPKENPAKVSYQRRPKKSKAPVSPPRPQTVQNPQSTSSSTPRPAGAPELDRTVGHPPKYFDDSHFDDGRFDNSHFVYDNGVYGGDAYDGDDGRHADIHLEYDSGHIPDNAFVAELGDQQQGNLYALLDAVNHYYQSMLKKHPVAMNYFRQRGLTDATIDTFGLGYAPEGWQHLEQIFDSETDGLRLLGLVRTAQNGREYNLFRDRVMFPIKDNQGRVVGFAGRAINDSVAPKYLNSSDSVVFQKQHILYGYHEARGAGARNWLMVEGYMDVISLYQAGIYGAVAPMGTAANQGQIERLLKFNDELVLCFDGDKAGQKAAMRLLDVAMPVLPDGKTLKFLTLRDNHDPDTFVKAYGKEAMVAAIQGALPISDYLYQVFSQEFDLGSTEQKAMAMARLKALTTKLPKGSSFRFLLNRDMYERLSARRFAPKQNPIIDAKISPLEQLYLCILYAPSLAVGDALLELYTKAGLGDDIDTLPTWSDLDSGLAKLIGTAKHSLDHLLPNGDSEAIEANAVFILSAMGGGEPTARLSELWDEFFWGIWHHELTDIRPLFDELLVQVVLSYLGLAQKHSANLVTTKRLKRQEQALINHDKRTKALIQEQFESLR